MVSKSYVTDDDSLIPCRLISPQYHSLIRVSSTLKQQYSNEIYVQCNEPIMDLSISCDLYPNHGHINSNRKEAMDVFKTLNFESHQYDSSRRIIRGFYSFQASCLNSTFQEAWMRTEMTIKVKLATELEYLITQSPIKTVVNKLLSPGLTNHQPNLLLGTSPLSLASQLHLPNILNDRHQIGIGLTLCC